MVSILFLEMAKNPRTIVAELAMILPPVYSSSPITPPQSVNKSLEE